MTYEEKLQKIVNKLKDERDLSRKGRKTKIIFDDTSFTKIRIREICKILLQLQDDEDALKILDVLQPIETVSTEQIVAPSSDDDYEGVEIIEAELFESSEPQEKRQLLRFALQNFQLDGTLVRYNDIKPFDKIREYASRQAWLLD